MKIRLTTFARPDIDLLAKLSKRYLFGGKTWKDLEFVVDDSYDKMIIFTYPHIDTINRGYKEKSAITFMTEPTVSSWAKKHPTSKVLSTHLHFPFFPKGLSASVDLTNGSTINIKKTEILSTITSELSGLIGHQKRLKFIYGLDKVFEQGLDIYGYKVNGLFFDLLKNYKGFLPDKYEGLWKYKYHFACENSFENGYFTEKLIDPIITETLCFYDGCTNIELLIDPRSYVKINVQNIAESIFKIVECIENNHWKRSLPYIRKEKKRFMTDLHPFNLIWMAAHEKDVSILYK